MATTLDIIAERDPIDATELELPALIALNRLLNGHEPQLVQLVGPAGEEIVIPPSLLRVLRRATFILAQNMAVGMQEIPKPLPISWAAELLHVPVKYLVGLLDTGELPSTGTGRDCRVAFADLMAYKRVRDARRDEALDELSRMSEELGLYDLEFPPADEDPCPEE